MSEAQTMEFRTELKQLLDIIIHSLYSEREIFLRELVSNASDAIHKVRFDAIADPKLIEGDDDWRIELRVDAEAGTLTVSDNGVGMDQSDLVENLGTIARSGTQEFLRALREAEAAQRPDLIGQFGVGFYSAFMVADEVTVVTRKAGSEEAVRWTSRGEGEFTIDRAERDSRGTDVTLHLKDDAKEFLEEWRLRQIVKRYSDFLEHPIRMEVERTEGEGDEEEKVRRWETLNSQKALWLREPGDVSEEDHAEFYRQISHDFEAPAQTIHFKAEGTLEYRALLYVPAKQPLDFQWGEPKAGLQLYIQRVFIMDRCEDLLPLWLRFVKGVVDSSDLPLNVSREMLQRNRVVDQIRKGVVNKVLRTLEDRMKNDRKSYEAFFEEFGPVLKEGVAQDQRERERLSKLLVFHSTRTGEGETVSLEEYVERMGADQEAIYYLAGDRREMLARSPYLEALRERGTEVLLLTDTVDEFVVSALSEFGGKPLKAADRGELDGEDPSDGDEAKQRDEKFEGLLTFLKTAVPKVKEVRLSTRLRESAACLVADEHSMSAHMERLLARMGRGDELPARERTLELNPEHPAVLALRELYEQDPTDARVEDFGRLLYDEAVLAEGSALEDPADMARRINQLIERAARA